MSSQTSTADGSGRAASPYEPPSVQAPKGGGAVRGLGEKFSANAVTGTASMSLPLAISRGRSGFQPTLSLSYDSAAGNGPFGFGWSLSTPSITRRTDRGIPRYAPNDATDVFILSGAEDLVPVLDVHGAPTADGASVPGVRIHGYRPRVEGLFARIERWVTLATGDEHWRSITRDNVTTLYGLAQVSRIQADGISGGPPRVFSWLISESYDDKGNWIVYDHVAEDACGVDAGVASEQRRERGAQRYLQRIRYGNRVPRSVGSDPAAAGWMFEVVLDYDEGYLQNLAPDAAHPVDQQLARVHAGVRRTTAWSLRPDPFSTCRSGFEVRTHRRCHRFLMFHRFDELGAEACLVRSQQLGYDDFDYAQAFSADRERAHPGSTRYGSFLCSVTQAGHVRDETAPVQDLNGVPQVTYRTRSLPPLRLSYSRPDLDTSLRTLDATDAANLPAGVDGSTYRLVDLDGEGVAGVLSVLDNGLFYKANLGGGHFGDLQQVPTAPARAALGGGNQLLDLSGNGRLDVVALGEPLPGFYERTAAAGWEPFHALAHRPVVDWDDANLRFVDLDGDGLADVLTTQDDRFTWWPSLGDRGFGESASVPAPVDDAAGPRLVLDDGIRSIYLADMSGDGLSDLVRIRNGEVSYWPNLGYGRFGARAQLDSVPMFDSTDDFDQRRIRLTDVDGTGPADIIYLGRDHPRVYFNQSGNGLSPARELPSAVPGDDVTAVTTADLLGTGTTCLVWSSPLPGEPAPLHYLDVLGGRKPNLLISTDNSMGARTDVAYASSTIGYLADKNAGRPWVTRLSFPVCVVDRVIVTDAVSDTRLTTSYRYRHGYFDELEREFRGFALVDQVDAEVLAPGRPGEVDASPLLTRSWFHTGAYLDRNHISDFFASHPGPDGYYREPAAPAGETAAQLLADTVMPASLDLEEEREACRALKGSLLRQEVYALDAGPAQDRPFLVTEQNFGLTVLQRRHGNRHAVFLSHPRERLTQHHDRVRVPVVGGHIVPDDIAPVDAVWRDDPRAEHVLTLLTDDYGNVLQEMHIFYPRRYIDGRLPAEEDRAEQARLRITATVSNFTNAVDTLTDHRTPLPSRTERFEVTGATAPAGGRLQLADAQLLLTSAAELDVEAESMPGVLQKRLRDATRTVYRRNDLTAASDVDVLESMALPFQDYRLALTEGLRTSVFGARLTDGDLAAGGYVRLPGGTGWWTPSNRVFYSPSAADSAAAELGFARAHFFLPRRFRTPFHTATVSTDSVVTYDDNDLLITQTRDPLENVVTVGERDLAGVRTADGLDYRVLAPRLVTDINRNRTAVAFDALGMVAGNAVMGKALPDAQEGDSLVGFEADLSPSQVAAHLADPVAAAPALLGSATSRIVYDIDAFARTGTEPSVVHTMRRETRPGDPAPAGAPRVQLEFVYCDGFGREVQTKKRAERGPVGGAADVEPRWVASGWKVFDSKARPVRQYEPFFSATHGFDRDAAVGVTSIRCYDAIGRVVATIKPDRSWEKSVFSPWHQETWDVNDTVLIPDPAADPDVGSHVAHLVQGDFSPTWYAARATGAMGPGQQRAARRAAVHAGTPTVVHSDSLGRTVATVTNNRHAYDNAPISAVVSEVQVDRVRLDIDGNQFAVVDALHRTVANHTFDLVGRRIRQVSMEAGTRWVLDDVLGQPLYRWDSAGRRYRSAYDALRRPTGSFMLPAGAGTELMVGRVTHGEADPHGDTTNSRGKVVAVRDQAGLVTTDLYDFTGNLVRSSRRIAASFDTTLDWSVEQPLEGTSYVTTVASDALNRPVRKQLPDGTVIAFAYNEADLLESLSANLRGETAGGVPVWTTFVSGISYDAKGQRLEVDLGNGARTSRTYDPLTSRLANLTTTRDVHAFPGDDAQPGWPGRSVQRLRYAYDAVGNVLGIHDEAQQAVFFRNRRVDASNDFTYDATYRLIEAIGREHLGQVGGTPVPHSYNDAPRVGVDWAANDGNAMGTYQERYVYDAAGNLKAMSHRGSDPVAPGWTRTFEHVEGSQIDVAQHSNRLTTSTVGTATETFSTGGDGYDPLGNMLRMPQLRELRWDINGHLQMSRRQAVGPDDSAGSQHGGEATWFSYDADGNRVRKVTVGANGAVIDVRVYIGDYELYTRTGGVTRESVHVMEGPRRVAIVETRTAGAEPGVPERLVRYQICDHVDSSTLELDDRARIVSYEEYAPFGSTTYQAVASQTQAPKRFRRGGRERDDETGLTYHSARYCAPWLGRWISCDPAGLVDGPNLYRYVRNNPLTYTDPQGTDPPADPKPLTLGPLEIGNLRGSASLTGNLNVTLNDIWSSERSIEVNSLSAGGHVLLHSDLRLPSLGLSGSGSYRLDLAGLRISHEFATAEIDGRATVSAGPFRVGLDISAYGSTVLPARIRLGDAASQLTGSLSQFHGWVGIHGHVEVGNFAIAGFSASGDVGPGAQGTLQVRGTVGIPSLSGGPVTPFGHLSGTATFNGASYNASGSFHAGLFPIPAYTLGSWSVSSEHGFSATGHYVGPQFGPNGLNVGINPTAGVTEGPPNRQSSTAPHTGGAGGALYMSEPGPSIGYTYFHYSPTGTTLFNVGVSPTSSAVPYYSGGVSQPLGGPSTGPYVGFQLRTNF